VAGFEVITEGEANEGVLRCQRDFEIRQALLPPDRLPEWRDFAARIAQEERNSAVLRRLKP